jgi:hypothetical protein
MYASRTTFWQIPGIGAGRDRLRRTIRKKYTVTWMSCALNMADMRFSQSQGPSLSKPLSWLPNFSRRSSIKSKAMAVGPQNRRLRGGDRHKMWCRLPSKPQIQLHPSQASLWSGLMTSMVPPAQQSMPTIGCPTLVPYTIMRSNDTQPPQPTRSFLALANFT